MQKFLMFSLMLGFALTAPTTFAQNLDVQKIQEKFQRHCQNHYEKEKKCPADICRIDGDRCLPQKCVDIPEDVCPQNFCRVVVNCAREKLCYPPLEEKPPACGSLSYAGQGAACCEGLVPRCGVEFLDATCDMEGKGTPYTFPICIACGDNVCGQFENRCNCPEDCGFPAQQKF